MAVRTLKPTVEVIRPQPSTKSLEQLAWLMDRAFHIPGTKVSVGLDAILGLLPIGGDVLTGLVQIGIVLTALTRYRVPRAVAARMAANVLIDVAVGAIPLIGDLFDVGFKANTRNVALLKDVQLQQETKGAASSAPSVAFLVGIAALLLVVLGLVIVGFVTVLGWLLKRP